MRFCALFPFILALGASATWAQQVGKITGTVTDATGAAVPDVTVEARSVETGAPRAARSNASGVYVISPLPVGDYSLEARKEGFKAISRSGLRIDINSTLTLDLQLEVGNVTERVTVEASAPTIETESQAIGNSRYQVQLRNLPIIVREVQALVGQTAGVPYGTTDTVGGNVAQGGRSAMQVLADGAQLNPFQTTAWPAIDGIGRRADLTVPAVESIAEVKWISNGGSAEYAQPTQVIVASKAGTNEYHGSLFESYRSGGMGARRWEAPNRESFVRHQFGGTVGGPIKKDKLFFFGGVDVFRHSSGAVLNARYPTAAERTGDLRTLLDRTDARGAAAPVRIIDPLTGQPFPGNIIPANRISPVATELLKMIPEAPLPGRITDFNAVFFKPQFDNSEKYDARVDWNASERDRIFARTTIARLDQASRFSGSVPGPYGYTTKKEWTHAAASNWTHMVNPTTIATFQFTFRSMPFKNIPSGGDTTFPIKINDVNPTAPFAGPPAIVIGTNGLGISDLFDRLLFNYSADYGYTFDPTLTKTIGNHNIKSGFTFLRGYKTQELASPPYGRFTTASDFNNARSTTSATGDAFADFLLGLPSSTDVTIGGAGAYGSKTNFAGFVQDDWKVSRRLTLNLGVRYDRFGFFEEMNKHASTGNFRTGKIAIPHGSESLIHPNFQAFRDRFVTSDQLGLPNTFVNPNRNDFAPRVGAAFRVSPGFVLRGGFGLYYVDITHNEFSEQWNAPPFVRRAQLSRSLLISQGLNVNSLYTFENPSANSSAAGSDTQLTSIGGFTEDYPTQRAYTWNFTVEKELGRQMGLRTSYVGNATREMSRSVRQNACVAGPTECLSRAAGDPTARRWQQFNTNIGRHTTGGESNFHSGEIELTRRFSGGLLFDVNYAFSRLLGYQFEATNPVADPLWRYDYGPISAQPEHIFHWNVVYELPFGRGRRLGGNMHPVAEAIVGGWMFSGLGTWQSGTPLTVNAGSGQSPTGATTNRADRVADGRIDHSGDSRGSAAFTWFDPAAYLLPGFVNASAPRPTRRFGSAGVGTVTGPRFFTFDMTLQKNFRIAERAQLGLRAEVFNPFNVPMLANPDIDAVSSNFGRIRTSNTAYVPRNLQLGLRFDF